MVYSDEIDILLFDSKKLNIIVTTTIKDNAQQNADECEFRRRDLATGDRAMMINDTVYIKHVSIRQFFKTWNFFLWI